jgi:hypothetical protein
VPKRASSVRLLADVPEIAALRLISKIIADRHGIAAKTANSVVWLGLD